MDGVISSFLNKLAEARDAEAAAAADAADARAALADRDAALAALQQGAGAEAGQLREALAAARADLEVKRDLSEPLSSLYLSPFLASF